MKLLSLGLVRAIIGGLVGAGIGMALVVVVRMAAGLPAWSAAPATFVGTFTGLIGFLFGVGAFDGWLRWVRGRDEGDESPPTRSLTDWTRYMSYDTNHKVIGVQYIITSLFFMFIAGIFALLDRIELAAPGRTIMDPGTFNTLVSAHGITMLAITLLGISGLMNYLLPLMLGARDMAFPRLNAFSYWITPPAGVLLVLSVFVGGFDTGWTAYPPLSTQAALGMQFMLLGFYIAGFSSIFGGINFITTIFKMRAPGMSLFRMPIFVWGALATAILQLVFTQFIGMAFLMVIMERLLGLGFFVPEKGGNVILYQHLFWFYSHPAVYIFVLPGLGVISELLPVFTRKPLFGYKGVAISSLGIAAGGAFVWGHHMFAAGIEDFLRIPFMVTTLLVAVPTGVKVFAWQSTMWMGKLRHATAFLFILSAI
ncbi:MAG: cbb3-type cytochrome c oxidase subunit I, partial [Dehalococcoidia bacterium]|nr:cbb3-type cytochrome c oxidase subunit I [Dehalococcoidia bacterium]